MNYFFIPFIYVCTCVDKRLVLHVSKPSLAPSLASALSKSISFASPHCQTICEKKNNINTAIRRQFCLGGGFFCSFGRKHVRSTGENKSGRAPFLLPPPSPCPCPAPPPSPPQPPTGMRSHTQSRVSLVCTLSLTGRCWYLGLGRCRWLSARGPRTWISRLFPRPDRRACSPEPEASSRRFVMIIRLVSLCRGGSGFL